MTTKPKSWHRRRRSWYAPIPYIKRFPGIGEPISAIADPLVTELYLIPAGTPGIEVGGPFDGLGLCGNASSAIELASVRVEAARRLGGPASGMSLMMEATLPWFVLGCAACCVGLAGAAVAMAADHLMGARLEHLETPLSGIAMNRARLAEAKIRHMQARALLYGRAHVQTEDIQALAYPVLRHRILTNFTATLEGVTTDAVIERILKETPSREGELTKDERFKKIFAS